jgi:hypothetical protein
MNKLIILTPSIIRGNLHTRSIGKFYDFFYKYFNNYEIFHIINIDEPENLKKYFNKYETMYIYNEIIPSQVNKIFITEPNPGFLQAWKKIVKKIEELNLINDSYLYYWLEDDWEPRLDYNIVNFFSQFEFKNTAYTFTDKAPLGSFRGGPFMTGSYFSNIFNIRKYMNDTCDPERQMQRWLRGDYQKNGISSIHRFSIPNKNISNDLIHIIIMCEESNIFLGDLNKHHYNLGFDKSIKFNFHLITFDSKFNLKYSEINNSNNFNLVKVDKDDLDIIFSNNYIKYFIIKPAIMFDIGREFNNEYGLQKWMKIEDNTGYANVKFYDMNIGNELGLVEEELRLNPIYTINGDFISEFENIIKCFPYLENEYFNKGINLNINFYSHIYGSYPNFNVIGDLIQLNYIPTINKSNQQFQELCFKKLSQSISNNLTLNEINNYLNKYFKFDNNIIKKINLFVNNNFKGKVLGINCYFFKKYNYEEKITIALDHLKNNAYDNIFIFTNSDLTKNKLIEDLSNYNLIYYEDYEKSENNEFDELERINTINKIIGEIKNKNDSNKLVELENLLKKVSVINKKITQNIILNYLILLKCDFYI